MYVYMYICIYVYIYNLRHENDLTPSKLNNYTVFIITFCEQERKFESFEKIYNVIIKTV